MIRSILALALIATASAVGCADLQAGLVNAVSTDCGAGMETCMSTSSTYSVAGYTTAVTMCISPTGCTAASVESGTGDLAFAMATTCDGDAAAASTGCMVILVFLVFYV
jgi:hypothetical protein